MWHQARRPQQEDRADRGCNPDDPDYQPGASGQELAVTEGLAERFDANAAPRPIDALGGAKGSQA